MRSGIRGADRALAWHRAVAPGVEVGEIATHGVALSRPRRGFESRWSHQIVSVSRRSSRNLLDNPLPSASPQLVDKLLRSLVRWRSGVARGDSVYPEPVLLEQFRELSSEPITPSRRELASAHCAVWLAHFENMSAVFDLARLIECVGV